ncbi:unnamed protein product [Chondrus crispus]|uniref:Vacuolar protein sorting-associated protein 45 n=1 Tax=Chondrus crispus TaxID=2769 RepID=R7QDY9_CHOCR|nr:unnamed protein product [Chondrus crispus]CDF35666.1 unnamed protein product [Chondrus crispus]|eukprot:XP_005715485.1 unnamed protein product [Chondrus crispus]
MDPIAAVAAHMHDLVSSVPGIKALLLDQETSRIISLATNQSTLLSHSVLLIETLKRSKKPSNALSSVRAVAFLRPTAENIHLLRAELHAPRFASYKLCFTNILRRSFIEEIADADLSERVTDVRELFADFYPLHRTLLSFAVVPCLPAMEGTGANLRSLALERTVDGVIASLLAIKRRPRVRFQKASSLSCAIAERVVVRMEQENELFQFRKRDSEPLLIVLDRREDPVTPLLNQWTYEAMAHELIGVEFNRVSLKDAPNVPDDFQELVLDPVEDEFFRQNRYKNFGDLGVSLKNMVDQFRVQSQSRSNLSTIEDMMKFVGNYPEFRKTSSNVSKHVALAGELSRLVGEMNLLEVSQLEQDLACREAEADHRKRIMELLSKPNVSKSDKLRIVMLYGLRYEGTNDRGLPLMKDALHRIGLGSDGIHLITAVKEYAGAARRSSDVFSNRSFFAMASNTVRRGIGGVDNIYTQHEPLLVYTIDDLLRGKLKAMEYPLTRAEDDLQGLSILGRSETGASPFIPAPRELVIVIAGGVTYEEAKCISAINREKNAFIPPEGSTTASAAAAAHQLKAQIILVGSCVHNSTSFAVEILRNATGQKVPHFVRPRR